MEDRALVVPVSDIDEPELAVVCSMVMLLDLFFIIDGLFCLAEM